MNKGKQAYDSFKNIFAKTLADNSKICHITHLVSGYVCNFKFIINLYKINIKIMCSHMHFSVVVTEHRLEKANNMLF